MQCPVLNKAVLLNNATSFSQFLECRALREVSLSADLTHIAPHCFNVCTALSHIQLPDGLTYIGRCAFANCDSLAEITLPGSLTYVGEGAFSLCPLLTSRNVHPASTPTDSFSRGACSLPISTSQTIKGNCQR